MRREPDVGLLPPIPSCSICDSFRRMFAQSDPRIDIDLGLLDKILETPCPTHDALLEWIRKDYDDRLPASGLTGGPYNIVLLGASGTAQVRVKVSCIWGQYRPGLYWNLLLVSPDQHVQKPGYGRYLDERWVDLGIVRNWMDKCIQQHGSGCRNPFHTKHVAPAWLIDTWDDYLVPGHDSMEFVAISYRWGASAGLKTDLQILKDARNPGGLSKSPLAQLIPPTLRNAMRLVQAIGERYLWADAICLAQSGNADMAHELNSMAAIYASAKMTLVVTDGDAMDGIAGLESISQPRDIQQQCFSWSSGDSVVVRKLPIMQHTHGCSPYFDRGWTFQEWLFSKRRLVFANKQVHWKCASATWHEDQIDVQGNVQAAKHDVSTFLRETFMDTESESYELGNSLERLSTVLSEYNSRQLTFPEDTLPAITGLLTSLSRAMRTSFLCGLPEMCFDAALMWDSFSAQQCKRRKYSGKGRSVLPDSYLPSWSWVGWQFYGLQMANDESLGTFSLLPKRITSPITTWYSHPTPESIEKRAVCPTWFNFREAMKQNVDSIVPEGWVKEPYIREKHGSDFERQPGFSGEYIFWHPAAAHYHWAPVPRMPVREDTLPCMPRNQHPYISCNTKRGWFGAVKASRADIATAEHWWQVRIPNRVVLVDEDGELCGWLQALLDIAEGDGDTEEGDKFSSPSPYFPDAMPEVTQKIELVAICLQHWPTLKPWVDEDDGCVRNTHTFYGVLWIGWSDDGVAYRRGSGFVEKDTWEAYGPEDIHLVLG